jgi:hypothetical protein
MDKIDLETPRFTQAEVLEMLPNLSAKTLQNWTSRGVFDLGLENQNPGRQGKRRYTGIGVVMLAFMAELTGIGLGPSVTIKLADDVAAHAMDVHEVYPAREENGFLNFVISGSHYNIYHRGYIVKIDDDYRIFIRKEGLGIARTIYPFMYITVEIDFLILTVLSKIYAHISGKKIENRITAETEEDRKLLQEITDLTKRLSSPGRKDGGNNA